MYTNAFTMYLGLDFELGRRQIISNYVIDYTLKDFMIVWHVNMSDVEMKICRTNLYSAFLYHLLSVIMIQSQQPLRIFINSLPVCLP